MHEKRDMCLRFQKIALDVSYVLGRNRSMFLIVVFLIKEKSVYDGKSWSSLFRHDIIGHHNLISGKLTLF